MATKEELYQHVYYYKGKKRKTRTWYYDTYRNGKRRRHSTGETDYEAAKRVMHRELAEGEPPKPGKATLADLRKLVEHDYEVNGAKSLRRVWLAFNALEAHFGTSRKVSRIDTRAVREYARTRRKTGRASATINRELAALRRGFHLAAEQQLVPSVPVIRALKERNVRKGFLRSEDFERLYRALRDDMAVLARVAYVTGWRSGELLSRKWRHCDLAAGWLRLEPGETKNEDGRMFPLPDVLLSELEHQHHMADEVCGGVRPAGPLFFYYSGRNKGRAIKSYYKAWRKGAKAAGLEGTLFHDMRRSAVRNLVRDGVSETVAMRLTGHRTRSVFKRYDIVDEQDLLEAMEKMNARHRQKS